MAVPQIHLRSISLPSRILDQTHPTNLELELEKLYSCSATSQTIQSGLLGLAEIYNSVEEFTHKSSHIQSMEESLSHSVDLLDACTAIRELLQMIRENVHVLQSALRRKGIDSAVAAYFCFRKTMHKTVAKTLKNLKKSESAIIKNGSKSNHSVHADSVFRQLAATTISVLKSVLVFLSSSAARPGGWSLVSKLMTARSGKESEVVVNEIGNMDLAVSCVNQGKMASDGGSRVVDVQKTLEMVDFVIEGFEGGLERLFRQLIQTRVSLLNINLTDH